MMIHSLWPGVSVALACLACVAMPSSLFAQAGEPAAPERRSVEAARLDTGERIELDGNLDEPVWTRALPAKDFIQVDPQNGMPATEPTEVRIAFDKDAFYIGVTAYDSEPTKWLGYQRRRDEFLASDDRFMWTIDTFLDARSGYFFEMNPSGLMADALLGVNGQNRQWDGIWNARARHTDFGWVLEIEIPFRTVNFNPASDTWGINFQRTVRRKNEDSIWMGWARNQGLQRMTNAGRVTGIRDVSQGHGLDIKPYGLFTAEAAPGRGQREFKGDPQAGIDLFYNPTPLLRANLTVNTDFAQTEVDQRQVNLTRFNLFFPEKRDFFLDGATNFDFASPTSGDLIVNPFFSRRIGLGADSITGAVRPQPIDFGTKLTGQIGGEDIGLLHVQTDSDERLVGEDFTAARLKHRMLRQSYIGAIYTRRDARDDLDDARHTAGLDMRLATNRFRGSQNLTLSGWAIHGAASGANSGAWAFGSTLDYPNDRWSARLDTRQVGEHFDPATGFVTRRNYRRYTPSVTFGPRPRNSRVIRQYTFFAEGDVQTDLENNPLVRNLNVQVLGVTMQSQDSFNVQVSTRNEHLEQPFQIRRGITLPVGSDYTYSRVRGTWQTANRRTIAVGGRVETGQFYSGTRTETVANLTLRLRPGYIVYLTGELNRIDLAEGEFTTRLFRVVAETQFTPFMALVNNIQYDTQSAVAGWQSRFRWIVRPGNDIYVVYTHNWLDVPGVEGLVSQDKRIATKLLYTYRF
ncbi:MAG: DUF5916 domain-containing protein [Vicinamibacterales bacterium]